MTFDLYHTILQIQRVKKKCTCSQKQQTLFSLLLLSHLHPLLLFSPTFFSFLPYSSPVIHISEREVVHLYIHYDVPVLQYLITFLSHVNPLFMRTQVIPSYQLSFLYCPSLLSQGAQEALWQVKPWPDLNFPMIMGVAQQHSRSQTSKCKDVLELQLCQPNIRINFRNQLETQNVHITNQWLWLIYSILLWVWFLQLDQ